MAKRSALHAVRLAAIDPAEVDYDYLSRLPFTDRALIQSRIAEARVGAGDICDEVFTGGTTGDPLVVPVSHREQKYISSFYTLLDGDRTALRRRGIHLTTPYHSHQVQVPVYARLHRIGVYDAGSFDYARRVLGSGANERGVEGHLTFIIGIERLFRAFTVDCRSAGWDPPTGLDMVLVNSQYVSRSWRANYEEYWKAPVVDRYGLAEVFGGATEDLASGWYIFDPPCVAEVIDPSTGKRLIEGVGEVVLTSLYPFQQELPMIRYRTGDLAAVTHRIAATAGLPAIRPLGRISQCVRVADVTIPACVFYEVFDSFAEVARTDLFRDAKQVRNRTGLGHPLYSVRASCKQEVVVQVDLTGDQKPCDVAAAIRQEYAVQMGQCWPENIDLTVRFQTPSRPDFISYSP